MSGLLRHQGGTGRDGGMLKTKRPTQSQDLWPGMRSVLWGVKEEVRMLSSKSSTLHKYKKKPDLLPAGSIRISSLWGGRLDRNWSDLSQVGKGDMAWPSRPSTGQMMRDRQDGSPEPGTRADLYPSRRKGVCILRCPPKPKFCVLFSIWTNVCPSPPKHLCQTKEVSPQKSLVVSQEVSWGYFEEHRWRDTCRGLGNPQIAIITKGLISTVELAVNTTTKASLLARNCWLRVFSHWQLPKLCKFHGFLGSRSFLPPAWWDCFNLGQMIFTTPGKPGVCVDRPGEKRKARGQQCMGVSQVG